MYQSRTKTFFCFPAILAVCTLLLFPSGAGAASLQANARSGPLYSCGDIVPPHCYGIVDWWGGVDGAATSIFTNQMYATGSYASVTNEMWLIQEDSTGATTDWIEIGTWANSMTSGEVLFWSHFPGIGTATHLVPNLAQSDFGKWGQFIIQRQTSNSFYIAAYVSVAAISTVFTSTMKPNDIKIGMELAGSSGAIAPLNGFTNNQSFRFGDRWYPQPIEGKVPPPNFPVRDRWKYPPTTSNDGGEFDTCIANSFGCF